MKAERLDGTIRVAKLIRDATYQLPVSLDELCACLQLLLEDRVLYADLNLGALFAALQAGFNSGRYDAEHLWAVIRIATEMDGHRPNHPGRWEAASPFVGCSGSGKKLIRTVNISTAAAIVAAASGARVLKMSSPGTSNPVGSLEVLAQFGIPTEPQSAVAAATAVGAGFIDVARLAPRFNARYGGRFFFPQPFSYVSSALLYPVPLRGLLLGIPHPQTELSAAVLRRAGIGRAMVVCGARDGDFNMDELSVFGPTRVSTINGDKIESFTFHPASISAQQTKKCRERGGAITRGLGIQKRL